MKERISSIVCFWFFILWNEIYLETLKQNTIISLHKLRAARDATKIQTLFHDIHRLQTKTENIHQPIRITSHHFVTSKINSFITPIAIWYLHTQSLCSFSLCTLRTIVQSIFFESCCSTPQSSLSNDIYPAIWFISGSHEIQFVCAWEN